MRRYDAIIAEARSNVRKEMKEGLAKLPEAWRRRFKLMYGTDNGRVSVDDASAIPINDVVNNMPDDRLSWALQQIDNSVAKLATKEG